MALSNSQYDSIMRTYQQQRFKDKREQDARIEEVYEKLPKIRQLEDSISSAAVSSARRLLDGDINARAELSQTIEDLKGRKAALLKQGGFPEDYMQMHYLCTDCHDTGYTDGKKCHCFRREEMKLLYAQSNIENVVDRENFSHFTYDYYSDVQKVPGTDTPISEYMHDVVKRCRDYIGNFDRKKSNILFTGQTGTGKTFLVNCIARELMDRCFSVIYLSANELFDIFSKNKFDYDAAEEIRDIYEYILDCELLIIDDLGTELINSFTASQLFYCINERIIAQKGTVISTNLPLNALGDSYTDRVASRIISNYELIPLYGDDIRIRKKKLGFT